MPRARAPGSGSRARAREVGVCVPGPGPGPQARDANSQHKEQAEAGSLQLHAEKKALARLLACGEDDLKVSISFNACIDCHEFFKSSSLLLDCRIGAPATDTFLTGRPGSGRGSRGLGPRPGPLGPGAR